VSPALLRRYRAERVLRRDFDAYRGRVLANVRKRLRACRVALADDDLEECYAQAWQGLYTVLLEGESVEHPIAWLTLVCYRRALDEHRARIREVRLNDSHLNGPAGHVEPDLAAALDDSTRLRHTFEALRGRLNARERQAASLCYLQGLTRAQAAAQMGVSEARMEKLMEGRGAGRPGVSAKVNELTRTIRDGGWCEQQASLMRALAFGILDPDGERHALAELHRRECPACRAYVLSLRGMAAVLPPLILPLGPFAAGLGGAVGAGGATGASGAAGAGGGAGAGGTAGAGGVAGGGGVAGAGGAAGVSGAAGGAGGASLLAGGSLAAKLATGCLLLAGVGGGCVALIAGTHNAAHAPHHHDLALGHRPAVSLPDATIRLAGAPASSVQSPAFPRAPRPASSARIPALGQAQRELGFERTPATAPPRAPTTGQARPSPSPSQTTARTAGNSGPPHSAAGEFEVR
jgi:RNA polymerase sigma factor (sigma-70 family)